MLEPPFEPGSAIGPYDEGGTNLSARGTVVSSGSADPVRLLRLTASGSITTSGAAVASITRYLSATGLGTTSGSAAILIPFLRLSASGLRTSSGSAALSISKVLEATGYLHMYGAADGRVKQSYVAPVYDNPPLHRPEIQIFIVDRLGGRIAELTEAVLTELSFKLYEYDTITFDIPVGTPGYRDLVLVQSEIQVWVDDELLGWGVPWRRNGGPRSKTVGCDDLSSLFSRRIVDDRTLTYTSQEQISIGAALVEYAQSEVNQPFRNLYIQTAGWLPSGKLRSERYERGEHAYIIDLLRAFPNLDDGFDWHIEFNGSGQRIWTPYYPERGTVHEDIVLEWGKNLTDYTLDEDGVNITTQHYRTGGAVPNSESGKMEAVYEDVPASFKYGVMQSVSSDGQQMDVEWLTDGARREVDLYKEPQKVVTLMAVEADQGLLGKVNPGDYVEVRIDNEGDYFMGEKRVDSVTWTPGDGSIRLEFVGVGE